MPYPAYWSIILAVLLKNWLSTGDGFLPSLQAQYIPIVKWSTALLVKHHTKIRVFILFWPGHSQKNAFLKIGIKRVYAILRFL